MSQSDLADLLAQLAKIEGHPHADQWLKILRSLVGMLQGELSRLDIKILASTLHDMEMGYRAFAPYQHHRKVVIFGSARLDPSSAEYQHALHFAQCITQEGFMVLTGGGGGIMEAGNRGAGLNNSFGLNIQLPFEQSANPVLAASDRVIHFKYFFSRKLFFLKESDAIALFPGGFGTQDEAFECLTLMQTGKAQIMPLILIDKPGGAYWQEWDQYVREHLLVRGLVSPEDLHLYQVTDDIGVACQAIKDFYRVFHSHRYVKGQLVLRINQAPSSMALGILNAEFKDILTQGEIELKAALPEEDGELPHLPRLVMDFNQRNFGRLWQLIRRLNELCILPDAHPEYK